MAGGSYYEVQVRPDASGWSAKLEAQIGEPMRRLAAEFERRFKEAGRNAFDGIGTQLRANLDPAARAAADNLRDQLRRGLREGMNGTPGNSNRQGNQAGRQYGDAFSREVKAKLEAAFRSLPDAPLRLNSSAADVELAEVRAKLKAAATDLELGVDTTVVNTRVEALEARLKALAANSTDVRVRVNTTAALAQIEAFRAALKGEGAKAADDFTDKFTRRTREKLQAAFKALPKLEINSNSSDVDRTIAEIRAKLESADDQIKLGVDSKVALAELDRLRARLRRLSAESTDIRVRVNAGTALAELEALKRAAKDEDGGKRGNIFTRLVASAREANPAIDGVIGKLGSVGGAVSSIGGNNLVGTIALVAVLVAALSTIGPIAGAAAGAVLGIAGAAGVAALAVAGIKKQMAEQVGYGEAISHLFKNIAGQLSGLGQVAANSVGPAITDILGLVRKVLPSFQGLIQLVGGRLGGAFREIGIAVVTAFQKAQPLIVVVAGYIEAGAAAFKRWIVSDGFTKFILFASRELPVVIDFAKALGTAIVGIFVALAPLGESLLRALTPLLNIIGKVGFLFGKLFGTGDGRGSQEFGDSAALIKGFQGLGSAAAGAAAQAGPLDNYKKIIGDLAPALEAAAGNSGKFQVQVTGIVDRLRAAAPALQAFIDTASSYDPGSAKVADTAKLLGDAFTAARGNALDYAATVVAADTATQNIAKTIHDNIASVAKDGTLLGISHLDAAGKFVDASNKYSEGSSNIVQGFQAQVKAATDAATATYTNELSTKGQAKAATDALTVYKGYRQSFIDSGVAAGTARSQVEALADQYFAIPPDVDTFVKLLGQDNVSLAIQGLTDALNRLSDFIGAPKVELNTDAFNASRNIANSDLDYFGARKVTPSADLDNTPLQNSLAIANAGVDYFGAKRPTPVAGLNSYAYRNALAVANSDLDYFGNKKVAPTISVNDFASNKIAAIRSALASLQDRTLTVTQRTILYSQTVAANDGVGGGQTIGSARGNIIGAVGNLPASVQHFARGGENHVAQISMPNGGFRVWAEPETQGEAYIPFAQDRRARSEGILADVAKRFNGAFLPDRALSALAASPASSGGAVAFPGTVTLVDESGSILTHARVIADQRIGAAASASAHAVGAGNSIQVS